MPGEELITALGFKYSRTCNCEGHATLVFTFGKWELRWRQKRYLIKLKRDGSAITNWINIGELESTFLEAQAV